VACDQLGFGDSTVPDGNVLDYDNTAAASRATVIEVMRRVESGTILGSFPPVPGATKIGIGQSMGGCYTLVLQGQHGTFDCIALLGSSAIHTVVPSRPGTAAAAWPWIPRGDDLDHPRILNHAALASAVGPVILGQDSIREISEGGEHPLAWSFHYDDVPRDIVALDMAATEGTLDGALPEWRSATTPSCSIYMVAPGTVALEAASTSVPVLVAVGERDVVPDPWMEPKAFKSCNDITVYVCPRMGHMHNFAGTRELLWKRIHSWGTGVAHSRIDSI
jgi:pimeloyl-ACP methyl ester carboxylesterase